jgi:hypothetical protein
VVEDVRMKQKIEDILEETGYKESRAAKMDLNDILKSVCCPSSLVLPDSVSADYYWPFMILTSISPDRPIILVPFISSKIGSVGQRSFVYTQHGSGITIESTVRHSQ